MKLTVFTVTQTHDGASHTNVFTSETEAKKAAHAALEPDFRTVYESDGNKKFPAYDDSEREKIMNEFLEERLHMSFTINEVDLEVHEIDLGRFTIILEGGLLASVVTDGPLHDDIDVIDYDIESANPDDLSVVTQSDGTNVEAYVSSASITTSGISYSCND